MKKQISNSPQSTLLGQSNFVIASSQTVKRNSGSQGTRVQGVLSNNSSSSSKAGLTKAPLKNSMTLKMAHPAVILHQEMQKQLSAGVPRKPQTRTTTNHSSSQSHSEGKSSSSRGSGGCGANSNANTPSKKGAKRKNNAPMMIQTAQSPKPRSQATLQLITASPSGGVSPKIASQKVQQTNLSKVPQTVLVERHSIKKHTISNSPTDTIRKSLTILNTLKPAPHDILQKKQNTIHKVQLDLVQQEKVPEDQKVDSLHPDFLNKALDRHQQTGNAPPNLIIQISKSPPNIKPAHSPPAEKLVIKKSEIKFSLSPSHSPVQLDLSPKVIQSKQVEAKNLDVIKKIINEHPKSPKKDGMSSPLVGISTLRLSLSGNNSPSEFSTKQRIQKSQINFVHDMKKHGIEKDLDSVKAMKQFLNNNSPQSVSPSLMIPNQYKNQQKPQDKQPELLIKTSFLYEELEALRQDETLGSGKSQESLSYQFPFHKRSRSGSPPFKEDVSHQASISSQVPSQHEEIKEDAIPRTRLTLTHQKSNQRITHGGPVIADRESMESVIKAAGVGSPGNIFFGQEAKPQTFSFSLKKHSKAVKKKSNSHREQEELERRIMNGTEVEEWLELPQRAETAAVVVAMNTEVQHSSSSQAFAPQRSNAYHHFSNLGFIGDIDDLEEDEVEKDMAGNDDWMFQTFQKIDGRAFRQAATELKQSEISSGVNNIDLIPQNLLRSLDLGDNHHVQIEEEQKNDVADAEIDDGEVAIPTENMGHIISLITDHALEFPRQQHQA